MHNSIIIKGAREHNLKNIDVTIPRDQLVVITGLSGSGKSSLAFDTIYAEGQRRYVESLSAYARQFLEQMGKPDVDSIEGLSPAISIEQKSASHNPRSTVGTVTEIYDYLRLLFARVGHPSCFQCGEEITAQTVQQMVDAIGLLPEGSRFQILAPIVRGRKGEYRKELLDMRRAGYVRARVDGQLVELGEDITLDRQKKHTIEIVVDRLVMKQGEAMTRRLADSVETAFIEGDGYAHILFPDSTRMMQFTLHYECAEDKIRYEEPDPRLFSFNNPVGACPQCQGFGRSVGIDMDLVVPDPNKSIRAGAIQPWSFPKWRENLRDLLAIAPRAGIPVDVPFKDLTPAYVDIIRDGYDGFDGLIKFFKFIERKAYKIHYRVFLSRYRGYTTCSACGGSRLRKDALNIRVAGKTIHDIVRMTIEEAFQFFENLKLSRFEIDIAKRILEEIRKRLRFLYDVGIGYISLDRLSMTLSGGESQRINLATALGSSLVGSLYVLDEPSIGLHPRDNHKLIAILKSLRDVGNTVIVVEHDEDMIREADVVVDMGPRAGEKGGEVVFNGSVDELQNYPESLTAQYLRGSASIPVSQSRRPDSEQSIFIRGASENNLKNIDVRIPLNMIVCVTGVSGSGKSTLVHDILYGGLKKMKGGFEGTVGKVRSIEGADQIDRVELVDQSPIGRTPRSNPVTYIKVFDLIRDLLASTPAAKVRGFKPGHFSFNVPGGRCETCEGDGVQKIEMQFLADLYLTCESCKGKRFKQEVLDIRFRGKNVDEILGMTVSEAKAFFKGTSQGERVARKLQVLDDVGLGYIRLGQAATSLSGGEAQRIKLANHLLASHQEGRILFIFDEPTTGLHFDDIAKLLKCFNALVDAGHSLLVIEHNMDVVKCADLVIDLGPEGGERGGEIVATGTPEELAVVRKSYTGQFLAGMLDR